MTATAQPSAIAAQQLVDRVKNLPPVSQAALRLVNLLDEPSADNDEVVRAIKCDNLLTAKLLRACNSPYFGLDEPIASVDQAVLILGHQQILHIVLTLAFGIQDPTPSINPPSTLAEWGPFLSNGSTYRVPCPVCGPLAVIQTGVLS